MKTNSMILCAIEPEWDALPDVDKQRAAELAFQIGCMAGGIRRALGYSEQHLALPGDYVKHTIVPAYETSQIRSGLMDVWNARTQSVQDPIITAQGEETLADPRLLAFARGFNQSKEAVHRADTSRAQSRELSRGVTFAGGSRVKGRNGYFTLQSAELTPVKNKIFLELYSKRRDGSAPVYMQLTSEDAEKLSALLAPIILDKYKNAIGYMFDLAYGDQDNYLQCADVDADYGDEWPAVCTGKVQDFRAVAEFADIIGLHGESDRWNSLANDFEETLKTEDSDDSNS